MIFLSYWFFIFLVFNVSVYWLIPNVRFRLIFLFISCFTFHSHYAGPSGVLPIVFLALVTYISSLSKKPVLMSLAIILNIIALVFYKYTVFICISIISLFTQELSILALEQAKLFLPEAPPLAISFFSFEFIHYLYEVRKGKPPIKSPLQFGIFSIYWPSIAAGPVKRYESFLSDLNEGLKKSSLNDVSYGFARIAVGLVKKFTADNLTIYISTTTPQYEHLAISERWLFLICIAFRILWDFSGYSDMTVGFSRLYGIKLIENFKWPYLATSPVEFWRRWHISLSSWIRDYVYIPLGGNKHGVMRKTLNGLLAFSICGLWHGSSWNFLVWGLYHGVGLAINTFYLNATGSVKKKLYTIINFSQLIPWALTTIFCFIGWLLFFFPVDQAFQMAKLLFKL